MTTLATMAVPRQPFSPLHSPRLQHLQNMKNRQNGVVVSSPLSDVKPSLSLSAPSKLTSMNPPTKRRLATSDGDDYDSENIDPTSFSSPSGNKRSKTSCGSAFTKSSSSFSLISKSTLTSTPTSAFSIAGSSPTSTNSSSSMAAPSAVPSRLIRTPTSPSRKVSLGLKRANMSSPRAPMTAPAGRSPNRARRVGDVRSRRVSAPFNRIQPPSFSITSSAGAAALPFSLDAALASTIPTLSSSNIAKSSPSSAVPPRSTSKLIEETMPTDWFFDIYEDSPDEEAANLMEHSTLTLDLSSDDETSTKRSELADVGKENVAPKDYALPSTPVSSSPTRPSHITRAKQSLSRRKIVKPDEMDDGQRSPLSDLETEEFFAAGLTKDSCIVIPASPEKSNSSAVTEKMENDISTTDFSADAVEGTETENKVDICVAEDNQTEILIWEDDAAAA